MKQIIHRANDRGVVDRGWLYAHHSFSFGDYHDPNKMGFGLLRVINDDIIKPGKGFGTHPHDNMEIVSIPLEGALAHKDSKGHEGLIRKGEVQLMSPGSGIRHSEFNPNDDQVTNLFQIWVMPEKQNIEPRYEQKAFPFTKIKNQWITLVSPMDQPHEQSVKINQQAYFSYGFLQNGKTLGYKVQNPGNGLYIIVIEGEVVINNQTLQKRDAMGLRELESVQIQANTETEVLVLDVPMV